MKERERKIEKEREERKLKKGLGYTYRVVQQKVYDVI